MVGTYDKAYGNMTYGGAWKSGSLIELWRAFLKFSLDSVPDTCRFRSVKLYYYQPSHWNALPIAGITLIPDPDSLSTEALFNAISTGRFLAPFDSSRDGWMSWPLDSTPITVFDSCRKTGWVSCGVYAPEWWVGGGGASAFGCDSAEAPYLHIEYASSGTREAQGIPARQPEPAFAPNPTTGRYVTVRCAIATGTIGKLTLRDVLGRAVKSFTLGPSGRTRLDLRGLAPGVYMGTLDGTMPLASRKLVITAR